MNYQRAALAATAGGIALLVIVGALAFILTVSYLLAANYVFGGGPRYGEILALTILPSIIGAGATLLTRMLGGRWLRSLISAVVAFVLALNTILKELETSTCSPGEGERSVASVLLLISAPSVLIATVRRADIPSSRASIVIFLVIVFVGVGIAGTVVVPEAVVEVSVLIAVAAWVVLPAFAALLLPPSPNDT